MHVTTALKLPTIKYPPPPLTWYKKATLFYYPTNVVLVGQQQAESRFPNRVCLYHVLDKVDSSWACKGCTHGT